MDLRYKKQSNCPGDDILENYKRRDLTDQESDDVTLHLLFCDACLESIRALAPVDDDAASEPEGQGDEFEVQTPIGQALLRAVAEFVERDASRLEQPPKTLEQVMLEDGLQVGQIWRTRSNDIVVPRRDGEERVPVMALDSSPHLVVITDAEAGQGKTVNGYHIIHVAPVSPEIEFAGEDDVTVDQSTSPLGYSFTIEAWNEQPMLSENLDACLASFDGSQHTIALLRLRNQLVRQRAAGAAIKTVDELVTSGEYHEPKLRWRAHEYQETAYLRAPVEALTAKEAQGSAANSRRALAPLSRLDLLVATMAKRYASPQTIGKRVTVAPKRTEVTRAYEEELPLAAAMADENNEATFPQTAATEGAADLPPGFMLVRSIAIRESTFELLQDTDQYIYLRGTVPPGATHLCLGHTCYELEGGGIGGTFKIEGLGSMRMERFLREHASGTSGQQVKFARLQAEVD
jgi:hypothetical protein